MSKIRTPKKPKQLQERAEQYQREPLPTWCRGIMGGCVNCGGCV